MKLSEQDAKLFFSLMLALQYFVNQKLKILNGVKSFADYAGSSTEKSLKSGRRFMQTKN